MRIVGLVGPKRSGKSTAAEVLVRERGFVSIGFADALKELALKVNPHIPETDAYYGGPLAEIVEQAGWEGAKAMPEVRRFLQELGTGVRDIDPGFWIRTWSRHAISSDDSWRCIVVPDVRFLNEAQALKDAHHYGDDGMLIRITRPELDVSDTHISETELLSIECDYLIVNDKMYSPFQATVLDVVDEWMRAPAS